MFNISESLLFMTKPEVIGSQHRNFPTQFFFTRLCHGAAFSWYSVLRAYVANDED